MKHLKTFEGFSENRSAQETVNEGQESLKSLLADASPEVQKIGAEIETMLEPARFKIGVGYYDKVMQKIAEIAKIK